MSTVLNKELIINWIMFHAVRYSHFKVIDIVMSSSCNKVELTLNGKLSENQHLAYAYIYSTIHNMKNSAVFGDIDIWSFCVDLLDRFYPIFSKSFDFIIQLQNKMKFIVLLQMLVNRSDIEHVSAKINQYFPIRNVYSQLKVMKRYQIGAYASTMLHAIFEEYYNYRTILIYYLFHHSQLNNYYSTFVQETADKWSNDMESKLKSLIENQPYYHCSPIDDILAGRFTGVDSDCENEVKHVKIYLSKTGTENNLTQDSLISLIKSVNNIVMNGEIARPVTENLCEEITSNSYISMVSESQQLIAEMTTGGNKRLYSSDESTDTCDEYCDSVDCNV